MALNEANVALFATTRMPQRETLFQWVGPLFTHTWGFYARKGKGPRIDSMQTARQVSAIGTYRRDGKMQYLQGIGFNNLVASNRNQTNIVHLMRGEIDLWASSDFTMPHLVRQAGFEPEQFELAYPFRTVDNYIAFSKKTSPHVVRLWGNVLDEIKQDGTFARICCKFNYRPQ